MAPNGLDSTAESYKGTSSPWTTKHVQAALDWFSTSIMSRSSFLQASTLLSSFLSLTAGQTPISSSNGGWSTTLAGTPTSFNPAFTIPPTADQGVDQIPNIYDPEAVNAQDICPGYKASDLEQNDRGLSATLTLAGAPCNAYGTDIEELDLKVEYQAKGRLAVSIVPKHLDASNQSQWIVPEDLIPRPQVEDSSDGTDLKFDCKLSCLQEFRIAPIAHVATIFEPF
jgi:alpha-glucosidase